MEKLSEIMMNVNKNRKLFINKIQADMNMLEIQIN